MNESKMTPGPWTVGERDWNVGVVFETILSENPEHPMNQEQAANARAIAALPELVEALRLAYAVMQKREHADFWLEEIQAALSAARNALEKAGL